MVTNWENNSVLAKIRRVISIVLSLMIIGQGLPLSLVASNAYAAESRSIAVVMRVKPDYLPPKPITDLVASQPYAENTEGAVKLTWTTPSDDDTNKNKIYSYYIRYSTFSGASIDMDTIQTWLDHPQTLTAIENSRDFGELWGIPSRKQQGQQDSWIITGLTNGQNYWFSIFALDNRHNISPVDTKSLTIDNQPFAYASTRKVAPYFITDLRAEPGNSFATIKLNWTCPGNDVDFTNTEVIKSGKIIDGQYIIKYSTKAPADMDPANWATGEFSEITISTGNVNANDPQQFMVTGLTEATSYYFYIWTKDEWPNNWSWPSYPAVGEPLLALNEPLNVSNLTSEAYASENPLVSSWIRLKWSNPDDKYISGVKIYRSTYTVYESSISTVGLEPYANSISGANENRTFDDTGLEAKSTYYYTLFTYNRLGIVSSTGVYTSVFTRYDLTPPAAVADLTVSDNAILDSNIGTFVDLTWTNPKDKDFAGVRVCVSTTSYPVSYNDGIAATVTGLTPGATAQFRHTKLNAYATYYYTLFAFDTGYDAYIATSTPNYSTGTVESIYVTSDLVPPSMVTALSVSQDMNDEQGGMVTLTWTNPRESDFVGVMILRSELGYPATSQVDALLADIRTLPGQTTTFTDMKELQPWTSYYYAIYAYDHTPLFSTVTLRVFVTPKQDEFSPNTPLLLSPEFTSDGKFKLRWRMVRRHDDGRLFKNPVKPLVTEFYRYKLYRADNIQGPWYLLETLTHASTEYVMTIDRVYFYKVDAIDYYGNCMESRIVDCASDLGIYTYLNDGTYVRITAAAAMLMEQEYSGMNDDVMLIAERKYDDEENRVIKSVEIKYMTSGEANNGIPKEVNGFKLSTGTISLVMKYDSFNNQVASIGRNAIPRMSGVSMDNAEQQLSLFWNNGLEWLKLGGKVDKYAQTLEINTLNVGQFQIRTILRADKLTLMRVVPKIITPNGDNLNDKVFFYLEDPNMLDLAVRIYDVNSAVVADNLEIVTRVKGQALTVLSWNGTDKDENTVAPGTYFYQIISDGKVLNGVIVVAR
ncbi:MAG: hypothetical protein WC955_09225 [Elusimicrobiota bacterium]